MMQIQVAELNNSRFLKPIAYRIVVLRGNRLIISFCPYEIRSEGAVNRRIVEFGRKT